MGITFRSGHYIQFVRFGGRTIKDGEAAAIWDRNGVHTQIVGPKRIWLAFSTIRFLTRHRAGPHQYLHIKYFDGRAKNVQGPISIFENPALHDAITVNNGIRLISSNECIIVRKDTRTRKIGEEPNTESVSIRTFESNTSEDTPIKSNNASSHNNNNQIIRGPTLYFPRHDEYVHEFNWSIIDTDGDLIPPQDISSLSPQKPSNLLRTNAGCSWKIGVPIVTADSVKARAMLVFNYQIELLEKCISVNDPIEIMHTAVMRDAYLIGNEINSAEIQLGEKQKLGKDQEQIAYNQEGEKHEQQLSVTQRLSGKECYPSLVDAAHHCGFRIDSINVLEIIPSDEFQEQIDNEQQSFAKLSSEYTLKSKRRELHELENEDRRNDVQEKADLERKQIQMNAWIEEESHQLKQTALERRIEFAKKEQEAEQGMKKQKDAITIEFLKALKELDVDITMFLCTAGGLRMAGDVISSSPSMASLAHSRNRKRQKSPSCE